jgi:hypothetical protein
MRDAGYAFHMFAQVVFIDFKQAVSAAAAPSREGWQALCHSELAKLAEIFARPSNDSTNTVPE